MKKHKLLPLIIIFSLVPLGPLAIDVFLPSIPQMVDFFQSTNAEIQLTISIYVLALGFSQLIAGVISDKYGRKVSILIGLALYGVGSLVVAQSPSILFLYLSRGIQGLGAAFTMVSAMAWVRDHYDGITAGKWMSYMGGITSVVPTVAPMLGSAIALAWGWTGGFYLMATIAFLIFMLTLFGIKSEIPTSVTTGIEDPSSFNCNLKDILSNKQFLTYTLSSMVSFGGLLSYVAISPIVAIKEAGFTQLTFATLFGVIGFFQIISSLMAPKLMEQLGRQQTVLFGLTIIGIGGVGLLLNDSANVYFFFVMSGLGCAGFSILIGAATSLSLESFKYCAGLATSIDGFIRMVGGALLAALASYIDFVSFDKLGVIFILSLLPFIFVSVDIRKYKRSLSVDT